MKKILALLVLFSAAPSWATFSGYTYRRTVTISSTNVSNVISTVTNIPILFSTSDVTLSTIVAGGHLSNAVGYDLVFSTQSDCSSLLFWDTETVNVTGMSTFTAWVNIPVLTTTTAIAGTYYVCYGNSGISTYQGHSTATWDANYEGVFHLGNGTTLNARDSTLHGSTGAISGALASQGKVGGGASFASGNNIQVSTINFPILQTIETWMNPTTVGSVYQTLFANGDSGTGNGVALSAVSADQIALRINNNPSAFTLNSSVVANVWNYIVIIINSSLFGGGVATGYLNGVLGSSVGISATTTFPVNIALGTTTAGENPYTGLQDEVRVSSIERNQDWVFTSYRNQLSPNTFNSIGSETSSAPPATSNAPFFGTEF